MGKKNDETFAFLRDRNLFKNSMAKSWAEYKKNTELKMLHKQDIIKGHKKAKKKY